MALLTVRSAAERLGVGYSTLKHWISKAASARRRRRAGITASSEAEIDRLVSRRGAPPGPPPRASSRPV